MVAMLISLIIMAGVVNSFLASSNASHINDELAYVQENARFALDYISRDVRQAGDFGCNAAAGAGGTNHLTANNLINVVATAEPNAVLRKRVGIEGFDRAEGVAAFPLVNASVSAGTDALVVRRADAGTAENSNQFIVQSHDAATGQFTLTTPQNFDNGTYLVAADADCGHQAIFKKTSVNGLSAVVGYNGAGNCTTTLRGLRKRGPGAYSVADCTDLPATVWQDPPAIPAPAAGAYNFRAGASLMPLRGVMYYIAPSAQDPSVRSLWITYITNGGARDTQELVTGVFDMRLHYGVDTDVVNLEDVIAPDGIPNKYLRANQIASDEPNPAAPLYEVWNRVTAVRIELLVRSRTQVLPAAQAVNLLGNNYNDRFLYQVVSTTVTLRNAFRG